MWGRGRMSVCRWVVGLVVPWLMMYSTIIWRTSSPQMLDSSLWEEDRYVQSELLETVTIRWWGRVISSVLYA